MISAFIRHFADIIEKNTNFSLEEILAMIEIPPENIPGDLAFPCFQLAKQEKNPQT